MTTLDVASAEQSVTPCYFLISHGFVQLHGGNRKGLIRCERSSNGRGAAGRPFELVVCRCVLVAVLLPRTVVHGAQRFIRCGVSVPSRSEWGVSKLWTVNVNQQSYAGIHSGVHARRPSGCIVEPPVFLHSLSNCGSPASAGPPESTPSIGFDFRLDLGFRSGPEAPVLAGKPPAPISTPAAMGAAPL